MTEEAPMTDSLARAASQHDASPASLLPTRVDAADFAEDDADFAAVPPRRRVPALTKLLFVAIIATLAFGGGVLVQKGHDATLAATPSVPNFASLIAGGGRPTGAGGATSSASPASGSTSDVPVLVGTIESISGSDLTVKDLGGTSHAVHATATTTISTVATDWSGTLKAGATVSIQGTKAADGSVTATVVTQR
jgi:Domain of unknown function (DUF5666)